MGVGRTQIMNILKRKSEILDDFKNNMPGSRKRQRRATGNEDINQLCWDWFQEATGRRINISGPLIQEQALKFAKDLGVDQFKASNGWLQSFLKRHNIVFRTLSGESGDVNVTIVSFSTRYCTFVVNKHFLITCYVCLLFCSCGHVTELTLVNSSLNMM
jgi:kinesin family protein 6/9